MRAELYGAEAYLTGYAVTAALQRKRGGMEVRMLGIPRRDIATMIATGRLVVWYLLAVKREGYIAGALQFPARWHLNLAPLAGMLAGGAIEIPRASVVRARAGEVQTLRTDADIATENGEKRYYNLIHNTPNLRFYKFTNN